MDFQQPIEVIKDENTGSYNFNEFYRVATHAKFNRQTFCLPSSVTLRRTTDENDPTSRCRIYFISYPRRDNFGRFQPTLFCADACELSVADAEIPWFQLFPDDFRSERSSVTLAESLLRERMRASATGLADYEIDTSGRIVATASSRIYCAEDSLLAQRVPEVLPFIEAPVSIPLQPVICPTNRDLIACVANSQLTVGHVPSNSWVPLTHVANESGISVGMPSYVVQEEFDRYIGYWWRPSSPNDASRDSLEYHILYELVDERMVEVVHLLAGTQIETHRYPRAGGANAVSDLRICTFRVTPEGEITNVTHRGLAQPLFDYLPGFEYLVRAGWTPDGKHIWCQLITRTQNRLELILIPVVNFQPINEDTFSTGLSTNMQVANSRQSPCIRLIAEEDAEFWVKVHNHLAFLTELWHPVPPTNSSENTALVTGTGAAKQSNPEHQVTFVWASHRSGYSHLYLMQRSWSEWNDLIGDVTPVGAPGSGTALVLDAEELFTAQLTTGSWEVTGEKIWLDETHQLIYFEANREHPLLQNIYAVSYADSTRGQITQLTPTNPSMVDEDNWESISPIELRTGKAYFTKGWSCFDPIFPHSTALNDYPLSYEVSALDVESGWAVLTSSSLNRLPGTQIVRIAFQSATYSTCGSTSTATADDPTPVEPRFRHVTWLRHHVSHHSAISQFIHPCDPPKVVRFDVEQAEFEVVKSSPSDDLQSTATNVSKSGEHGRTQTFLYGLLYLPSQPPPPSGFPTVHFVYGGPSIQLVKGVYSKSTLVHAMLYCHFGYAVFLCDCRGSANRGVQFAGHLKGCLGQVELDDHVAFLNYVAKSTGLIDMSRVAITGSSYGGYISLMAAMRYSHIYRASIACSPVVDWIYYDTAYTERYLGLPRDNPNAFWNGNVMHYVDNMPSDMVRLMICHGGLDENVHFAHTSRLLQKLEMAGKPFTLLYFPTSRHGIKEYEHLEASLLQLLESVLKPIRTEVSSISEVE